MVIVGFGPEANAKDWKERNEFPCQMVADVEAKIYRELGLKRKVAGVWGVPLLIYFAEKQAAGNLSFAHYAGDDSVLLGGDFITDSSGKLVWAHIMEDVTDRPSVDTIVAALDNANN